jgi:hypothetical protein
MSNHQQLQIREKFQMISRCICFNICTSLEKKDIPEVVTTKTEQRGKPYMIYNPTRHDCISESSITVLTNKSKGTQSSEAE